MAICWRRGSAFKVDASIAKQVMDGLAEEGRLTPSDLVEVSRPKNAPLHDEFEWDDKVAAEKWREETGRLMISNIVIVPDEQPDPQPTRVYFNIERGTKEYIPTEIIFSDEAKKQRLLEIALRELQSFREKYKTLNELAGVMTAIDEVLDE